MRVLNVVSVLSGREGGGNAERTVQLARALAEGGTVSSVLTLNIGEPLARIAQLGRARLRDRGFVRPVTLETALRSCVRQWRVERERSIGRSEVCASRGVLP